MIEATVETVVELVEESRVGGARECAADVVESHGTLRALESRVLAIEPSEQLVRRLGLACEPIEELMLRLAEQALSGIDQRGFELSAVELEVPLRDVLDEARIDDPRPVASFGARDDGGDGLPDGLVFRERGRAQGIDGAGVDRRSGLVGTSGATSTRDPRSRGRGGGARERRRGFDRRPTERRLPSRGDAAVR